MIMALPGPNVSISKLIEWAREQQAVDTVEQATKELRSHALAR